MKSERLVNETQNFQIDIEITLAIFESKKCHDSIFSEILLLINE
jgi:hypothetical protein